MKDATPAADGVADERPRSADVVARSDLDLMVLERDSFRAQLRENPEAAEQMLELLANRMAAIRDPSPVGGP